jgi:hypothetical protein
MRNHPPPPHDLQPLHLNQPPQRMKRTPNLKRPDPLLMLTLEEDINLWVRRRLLERRLLPRVITIFGLLRGRTGGMEFRCASRNGRRCYTVEGLASYDGGFVDVLLYAAVGGLDGGAGEGGTGGDFGHCVCLVEEILVFFSFESWETCRLDS